MHLTFSVPYQSRLKRVGSSSGVRPSPIFDDRRAARPGYQNKNVQGRGNLKW